MKIAPIQTIVLTLAIPLTLTSCAVLTDSQVKNINAFAATAKGYSAFPSTVMEQRAALHLHTELVGASHFSSPDQIDRALERGRKKYDGAMAMSAKFDLSLRLLQQYAGLLTKLSSDHYISDLDAPSTSLGENLDNLVATYNSKVKDSLPAGLGANISKVILMVGKVLTRHKQTAALKEFVLAADTLVQVTAGNLVTVLEKESFMDGDGNTWPSLQALLAEEKKNFMAIYRATVFGNTAKIDYPSVKWYYDELLAYDNTEQLRQSVVTAAKSLARAHRELAKNVQEKKDLKGIIETTQKLVTDVQTAGSAFSSLSTLIKIH